MRASVIVFCLLLWGCPKASVDPSAKAEDARTKKIYELSDNKCQAVADGLFDTEKLLATADSEDAIELEFSWTASSRNIKEQKIHCYFKNRPQ